VRRSAVVAKSFWSSRDLGGQGPARFHLKKLEEGIKEAALLQMRLLGKALWSSRDLGE
jgi:hypothetical protein